MKKKPNEKKKKFPYGMITKEIRSLPKIATRESYGNALVELGKEQDNLIVLDADLAAATKTGIFKILRCKRFISTLLKIVCVKIIC